MLLLAPDGGTTILTYCTNVHPIEDLAEAMAALQRWCRPVRERLGVERLALGLWLSRRSSRVLADSAEARERLRGGLDGHGLELVTLNGFPYGDFHAERVKEDVYRPDWADPRRYEYTLDLARILAECLPSHAAEGTISTLPLGYAPTDEDAFLSECAIRLAHLAVDLDRLAERSGRSIRVCLEPEPGCVIETTGEAVAFFEERLRTAARTRGVDREILDRHLGLCFDCCHQAVQFEDVVAAWEEIERAGIRVGKVQLSCALETPRGVAAGELLSPFVEPRFLHQVRRQGNEGRLESWMDLPEALADGLGEDAPVRVHFHSPLDWAGNPGGLRTTVDTLERLVPRIAATRPLPHLEVETYTWNVLPEALRPRDDAGLVEGIAREIAFVGDLFERQGLRRA